MAAQLNSTSVPDQATASVPYSRALIASDASLAADGAFRVGAALAARDQATLSLISVVEPMPYPMPVNDLALSPSAHQSADEAVIKARRHDLDVQAERTGIPLPDDVLVECSVPLSGILFHATARKADLIILGLGRHRAVDRLFGTETALHAVREADVATLAVPGGMQHLPRHAVVGTDFDASSIAAARGAARLIGPHGTLTLVHVDPLADPLPAMLADWPPHVLDRLNEAFARTVSALSLPPTMQVEMVTLAGIVSKELITYAEKVHADLIAVGRHSRSLVERMVLGSSTTRVIRTAHCAVLVVPRES
jgi:nucleotide-binding universal stress UspA family protein